MGKRTFPGGEIDPVIAAAAGDSAVAPSDEPAMPAIPGVESFAHGADTGIRGRGATLEQAFSNAALALTCVIANPHQIRESRRIAARCEAPDLEMLLVRWINEIVFQMSAHRMLFGCFEVAIHQSASGWALQGYMTGERVDPARHHPAVEVKGATFTELAVRQERGAWCAQCVVDV
jgi:SHS2 domain-containing protein